MSRPSVSLAVFAVCASWAGLIEIGGHLPMRQRVADFGGDERPLPVRRETGLRQGDRFGVVVENRDADFIAQFRAGLHQSAQAVHNAVQVQLRAEDQIGFGAQPVPEHEPEFVLEKPRKHPVRPVADELAELRLGRNRFGQIVLLFLNEGLNLVTRAGSCFAG